jgi:hypothetical protein
VAVAVAASLTPPVVPVVPVAVAQVEIPLTAREPQVRLTLAAVVAAEQAA